jgi:hypothetical protein
MKYLNPNPRFRPEPPYSGPISLLVTVTPDEDQLPIGTVLSVAQLARMASRGERLMEAQLRMAAAFDCGNFRVEVIREDPEE